MQLSRPTRVSLSAVLMVLVLVALLVGALLGGQAVLLGVQGPGAPADYSGSGSGEVKIVVPPGASTSAIAEILEGGGVVKSAQAFTTVAASNPQALQLQPGTYLLPQRSSAAAALKALLDPARRVLTRLTLPEGIPLRVAQERILSTAQITPEQLRAALANPASFNLPAYANAQPEGFLFPATYDLEPGTSPEKILAAMTARFAKEAAALDLEKRAALRNLSPYEIVTVASLIEAETALDADRSKVARVVYNRLARGMPLQFDSTVNYVREERAGRLSLKDIEVDSPYNTYRNKGLPPTPINSPGSKALEAALNPAAGEFIYFVTIDRAGNSLFTASYDEFLAAKAKAQAEGVY